jgi:hypothetical protein
VKGTHVQANSCKLEQSGKIMQRIFYGVQLFINLTVLLRRTLRLPEIRTC